MVSQPVSPVFCSYRSRLVYTAIKHVRGVASIIRYSKSHKKMETKQAFQLCSSTGSVCFQLGSFSTGKTIAGLLLAFPPSLPYIYAGVYCLAKAFRLNKTPLKHEECLNVYIQTPCTIEGILPPASLSQPPTTFPSVSPPRRAPLIASQIPSAQ